MRVVNMWDWHDIKHFLIRLLSWIVWGLIGIYMIFLLSIIVWDIYSRCIGTGPIIDQELIDTMGSLSQSVLLVLIIMFAVGM